MNAYTIELYCNGELQIQHRTEAPEKDVAAVRELLGTLARSRRKTYRETQNVGKVKYLVSFHGGEKTHPDGSAFFDVATFKNKVLKNAFIAELEAQGFTPA